MSETRYKFKYSNYDLSRYMECRGQVAQEKRRLALILQKEADIIDSEMRELELTLVPINESEGGSE